VLDAVAAWFKWLHRALGINLTIFYDPTDRTRMAHGILTTIELSLVCIALSLVIGVVGAWLQRSRLAVVRRALTAYVQIFRNTPPLVQLYFFYFALSPLIVVRDGTGATRPLLTNFAWATIALSLFAGAFNVEIFRAGLEAVPRTTIEAAESLGYSRLQAYVYIVLPLAFRVSLPALANNLVNLVKTTSLAYAIAVPEMLYVANQIWSDELNVPEMMTFILFAYVALVAVLVAAMQWCERKLRIPGYGI
jgi:polar amino acid transport system permease protein